MTITKDKLTQYSNLDNWADIECKGLWQRVNTLEDIHCLCSIVVDPETQEEVVVLFHDNPEFDNAKVWDEDDEKEYTIPLRAGSLLEGFRYWFRIGQSEKGMLHVHNCHGYDEPIIRKVLPKCVIPFEKWDDSFNRSKVQWFERPNVKGAKSPHGLQAYGIKFGVKKPPITDWETMDVYKLHRVIEDCKIQKKTSEFLKKEFDMLVEKGINLTEALTKENLYTQTCFKQEVDGAMADVDHIRSCITYLDTTTEGLAQDIEPKLPKTCKVSGGKISRVEMAGLFGYDTSRMRDQMETVKRNGEMVTQPVKPYYKPTMNFHSTEKTNCYSGFSVSHGFSPEFRKKNDLTRWIKTQHPDGENAKAKDLSAFVKEWDITKEIKEKKLLNKNTCEYFEVEPEDTEIIIGPHTKIKFLQSKLTQHEVVKGYLIKQGITWAEEWNDAKDSDGNFIKAEFDTEIRYPEKALPEHQIVYKVKKGENMKTSPKFGEKEYEQLESEEGKNVGLYNTLIHRRRFLSNPKDPDNKGILSGVREDQRIPAGVNNFGTATGRS